MSSWASVLVAVAALLGMAAGRLWGGGRREGRIDVILERLTEIAEDHEDRIRLVEQRPAERRRR